MQISQLEQIIDNFGTFVTATKVNQDKVLVVYTDMNGEGVHEQNLCAKLITCHQSENIVNTQSQKYNNHETLFVKSTLLKDGRVLVIYSNDKQDDGKEGIYGTIFTIHEDDTITSTEPTKIIDHYGNWLSITQLPDEKIVIVYNKKNNGYMHACVLEVENNSIFAYTPVKIVDSRACDITTTTTKDNRVVVCYIDRLGNKVYAVVLSINEDNTINIDIKPRKCVEYGVNEIATTSIVDNKILLGYISHGYFTDTYVNMVILDIVDNTITISNPIQCNTNRSINLMLEKIKEDNDSVTVFIIYNEYVNKDVCANIVTISKEDNIVDISPQYKLAKNISNLFTTKGGQNTILIGYTDTKSSNMYLQVVNTY